MDTEKINPLLAIDLSSNHSALKDFVNLLADALKRNYTILSLKLSPVLGIDYDDEEEADKVLNIISQRMKINNELVNCPAYVFNT